MRFLRTKSTEDLPVPEYLRFNLLPADYLERRRRVAFQTLRIVLVLLVLGAISGLTIQQYIVLNEHELAAEAARAEIGLYAEALRVEKDLAVYRTEWQNRQTMITDTAMEIPVHQVLEDVAESVPGDIVIDTLRVGREPGLSITGRADTLYQVSHFSSVLRDIDYLPEPVVTFPAAIGTLGEANRVRFQMEIPWDLGGDSR